MKLQLIWNRPSSKEKSLKLSVNISRFFAYKLPPNVETPEIAGIRGTRYI